MADQLEALLNRMCAQNIDTCIAAIDNATNEMLRGDQPVETVNSLLTFILTKNWGNDRAKFFTDERVNSVLKMIDMYFRRSPYTGDSMKDNIMFGLISNCILGIMDFSILHYYVKTKNLDYLINERNKGGKYPLDMAFLGEKGFFGGRSCLKNTDTILLQKIINLISKECNIDKWTKESIENNAKYCNKPVRLLNRTERLAALSPEELAKELWEDQEREKEMERLGMRTRGGLP